MPIRRQKQGRRDRLDPAAPFSLSCALCRAPPLPAGAALFKKAHYAIFWFFSSRIRSEIIAMNSELVGLPRRLWMV